MANKADGLRPNTRIEKLKIVLAILWLAFTSSLTVWWMYFAISLLQRADPAAERHRTMLIWEGATLLALLLIGGSTVIYFILHERQQTERLKEFFAAFTHDLKTALAGVRLQTESLREDVKDASAKPLLDRLLGDTSRLEVQLENSLFVGRGPSQEVFLERVQLSDVLDFLSESWPNIAVERNGDARLKGDKRALQSLFNNVIHNAIVHGGATRMTITVEAAGDGLVRLLMKDNGSGFSGDRNRLGEVFYRHVATSGSGLGLYTVGRLIAAMRGAVSFPESAGGFTVEVILPGELIGENREGMR